jgi:hypothetical protein
MKGLLSLTLVLALGCGEPSSVNRYDVAGHITWNGQPLKAGYVTFNPDSTKGNSGPQGIAMIADGKFDTRLEGGRGASPGAQILDVSGYDGKNTSEDNPLGRLVFVGYKRSETFDKDIFDLSIEIPKDAVIVPSK